VGEGGGEGPPRQHPRSPRGAAFVVPHGTTRRVLCGPLVARSTILCPLSVGGGEESRTAPLMPETRHPPDKPVSSENAHTRPQPLGWPPIGPHCSVGTRLFRTQRTTTLRLFATIPPIPAFPFPRRPTARPGGPRRGRRRCGGSGSPTSSSSASPARARAPSLPPFPLPPPLPVGSVGWAFARHPGSLLVSWGMKWPYWSLPLPTVPVPTSNPTSSPLIPAVFMTGCRGMMSGGPGARRRLGAEVAKDLVLSGVRSLTVWDGAAALVTWEDVATDCLLTPEVCPRTPSPAPLIKKQHQQQQFPPTQGDKPRTSCPQPPPPKPRTHNRATDFFACLCALGSPSAPTAPQRH